MTCEKIFLLNCFLFLPSFFFFCKGFVNVLNRFVECLDNFFEYVLFGFVCVRCRVCQVRVYAGARTSCANDNDSDNIKRTKEHHATTKAQIFISIDTALGKVRKICSSVNFYLRT